MVVEREKQEKTDAANSGKTWPLTPLQSGLLAESIITEDPGLNVEQIIGELEEPIRIELFRDAWQKTVDGFDALRLKFSWPTDAAPSQTVIKKVPVPFKEIDWSAKEEAPEQLLEAFMEEERRTLFDLTSVPLLRVGVLRLSATRWCFVLTIHHAIIDGGAYTSVVKRVFDEYEALVEGRDAVDGELPSYTKFLKWLSAWDQEQGVQHFKSLLEGVTEETPLPAPTGSLRTAKNRTLELTSLFSRDDSKVVIDAAKEVGVTPNTLIQFAWGMLLSRYGSVDDVVFGAVWSGRPGTVDGARQTVGPFINTLPIRITFTDEMTVREGLKSLREQHIALRPYQHTPLTAIKEAVDLGSTQQLFRTIVLFEYERFDSELRKIGEKWQKRKFWSRSQTGYPLDIATYFKDDALQFLLEYDVGVYTEKRALQVLDDFKRVLTNVSSRLDDNVHTIEILSEELLETFTSKQLVLERAKYTKSPLERIFDAADRFPNNIAISEIATDKGITYSELTDRINGLAGALKSRGVQPGDIVGILVPRSIPSIVAMLGIHAAGAAFLPLDPANPKDRLEYMVEDSKASCVLVTQATAGTLETASKIELRVDLLDMDYRDGDFGELPIKPRDLAYVIYTSGSTGKPKGVCIPHEALSNHQVMCLDLFSLVDNDKALQFAAHSFDASLEEIFPTLAAGATLVLRRPETSTSARNFFDDVVRHDVTILNLPTAFWHQLVIAELPWPASVRLIVVGGERVASPLHARFRRADTKHIKWLNTYGPTETTITSTYYDDEENDHDENDVPIGRPVKGLSHFALDHRLRPVPPGAVGQLYIGGAGLAKGYLFRPKLTKERFIPHPWRKRGKLYATGDRIALSEKGNWSYVDRIDNQVKVRGFRIELGEIEACIRKLSGVDDAAVVVQKKEGTEPFLAAFILSKTDGVTQNSIREHVGKTLPPYMVPARISIQPELPKTPAGKINRRALASMTLPPEQVEESAPQTADALEKSILEVWSELLNFPIRDTNANFFELGGNSLVAVQMFSQAEQRFDCSINPAEFFNNPTVRALADQVRSDVDTDWRAPVLQMKEGQSGVQPLFLAPVFTGTGVVYMRLANALDASIPVFALQSQGLAGGSDAMEADTLRGAAEQYVDLMKEKQPEGPYAVLGFSSGGVLALTIAEVLYERGEKIQMVGLIDSIPPDTIPIPSPFTNPKRLWRLGQTVVDRVKEVMEGPDAMERLWIRSANAARRVASKWLPLNLEHGTEVDDLFVGAGVEFQEDEKEMMQAQLNMVITHEPRRHPINVVLFRSNVDPFEGPHESDLGWHRTVTGRVTVETLPLRHHEMLTVDGVPRLAGMVRKHLFR